MPGTQSLRWPGSHLQRGAGGRRGGRGAVSSRAVVSAAGWRCSAPAPSCQCRPPGMCASTSGSPNRQVLSTKHATPYMEYLQAAGVGESAAAGRRKVARRPRGWPRQFCKRKTAKAAADSALQHAAEAQLQGSHSQRQQRVRVVGAAVVSAAAAGAAAAWGVAAGRSLAHRHPWVAGWLARPVDGHRNASIAEPRCCQGRIAGWRRAGTKEGRLASVPRRGHERAAHRAALPPHCALPATTYHRAFGILARRSAWEGGRGAVDLLLAGGTLDSET